MTKILRGLRGATTARANTSEAILQATAELLRALLEANGFQPEDVESAIFTSSPDLTAEYPARAARLLGWHDVPLLGAAEVPVPDGLPRCTRVPLHSHPTTPPRALKHISPREAHTPPPHTGPRLEGAGGTGSRAAGLASVVVDRDGPYVVAQLLSAGLERVRDDVVAGIRAALEPDGVLLRNDAAIRRHEGLPLEVVPADGVVPDTIEVAEHGVRYLAAARTGQKTGAFLDQPG